MCTTGGIKEHYSMAHIGNRFDGGVLLTDSIECSLTMNATNICSHLQKSVRIY